MATVAAEFSTGEVTLSSTTADNVNLYRVGAHKLLVTSVSGSTTLNLVLQDIATAAVASAGTLTIAEPVTDGDTFTVGTVTYTLKDTLAPLTDNQIHTGGSEANTKTNIVAAINGTGTAGTDYSWNLQGGSPVATAAAFSGDTSVFTLRRAGARGDNVVFSETFTHVSNVMDGSGNFGGTTPGADAVSVTATAAADRYCIPAGQTLELSARAFGIQEHGCVASIVGDGNTYIMQLVW